MAINEPGTGGRHSDLNVQIQARIGQAAMAILRPLARLFVANGVTFREAEQLFKRAFFDAAQQELKAAGIKSNVSRISLSTGLHRRDVKRMTDSEEMTPPAGRTLSHSLASELYMRWSTDPAFNAGETALPLRSENQEPSFDSLARQVNTDAHPRSLLEELKRLGLVQVDELAARVTLKPGGFVPILERTELLGLLGDNVGAHIATAVGNVVENGARHLEQAIYEDGLTAAGVEQANTMAREIWANASARIVPAMSAAPNAVPSEVVGSEHGYQVRIGMYMYTTMPRSLSANNNESDLSPSGKRGGSRRQ